MWGEELVCSATVPLAGGMRVNKAGRLVSGWMERAEGWKDGHGVGEWLAKGLTVCWWQVSFKEQRQGGLCQKEVGCQGWGCFSKPSD